MDLSHLSNHTLISIFSDRIVWSVRVNSHGKPILTNLGNPQEYPLRDAAIELEIRLRVASEFLRDKAKQAEVSLPDNFEALFERPQHLLELHAHYQNYTFIFLSRARRITLNAPVPFKAYLDEKTAQYYFSDKGGFIIDHKNTTIYIGYPDLNEA